MSWAIDRIAAGFDLTEDDRTQGRAQQAEESGPERMWPRAFLLPGPHIANNFMGGKQSLFKSLCFRIVLLLLLPAFAITNKNDILWYILVT